MVGSKELVVFAHFTGNDQFLPSKSVKKGEYSPVECTVYTDFDFQNA
jgi:hypothetical protein